MPIYVASTVNTQYKPGERNGRAGSAQFRAPSSLCEVPLAAARKALQAVAPPEDLARATAAVMVADTGNNCTINDFLDPALDYLKKKWISFLPLVLGSKNFCVSFAKFWCAEINFAIILSEIFGF